MTQEETVRTFLQPFSAHREQSQPQFLLPVEGSVLRTGDESVMIADVEQSLTRGAALGIDGEPPHQELQESFEFRLHAGQQARSEVLEAPGELGPQQLLQGIVQLEGVQLGDPQDAP